jgi:hypothetical protein
MPRDDVIFDRRTVLQTTGATLGAAFGVSGTASAGHFSEGERV